MGQLTSGKVPLEKTIKRQVLPHAPSPTITSLRLISDMLAGWSGRRAGLEWA